MKKFFDQRLGLSEIKAACKRYLKEPVPKHINWWFTLGFLALSIFFIEIISGTLLAVYYKPTMAEAHNSVRDITYALRFGWLIRSIHYWGAQLMVITIILHMARVYFYAGYKKPRELTWVVGICLLILVMAFAFTGYLLPMDQLSYTATNVGIGISQSVPFIGNYVEKLLKGGEYISDFTLGRFYVMHILILPAALIALVLLHLFLIRRHGISTLEDVDVEEKMGHKNIMENDGIPFHPNHTVKEITAILIMLALLVTIATLIPKGLSAKADLTMEATHIKPEWYFLWQYQFLKYFTKDVMPAVGDYGKYVGIVATGILILLALLLPFIDRAKGRRAERRKFAVFVGILAIIFFASLTLLGYVADREFKMLGARYSFDNYGVPHLEK